MVTAKPTELDIPVGMLPADGRFGSGPAKVRAGSVARLALPSSELGTSHRQPPVRALIAQIRDLLGEMYRPPPGWELVLGNGGSSQFWDIAVCSLIQRRSAHAVFGEFSAKFARAAQQAPHLEQPIVHHQDPGAMALPAPAAGADAYAWPQNETSTGVVAPVRRIVEDGALMLVDATSSAGGIDVDLAQTDAWYFAPQKNLGSDGGLWLAYLSPAAIDRAYAIHTTDRWIPDSLSLVSALEQSRQDQTTNTPAIATLIMLVDQLQWLIGNGGIDFAQARSTSSSQLLYTWAEAHPLAMPFVTDKQLRSPVVATIDFVAEVDAKQLAATLRQNGIRDIEPYRKLGRNQIRVGTYPAVEPSDVAALCRCIDWVLERTQT